MHRCCDDGVHKDEKLSDDVERRHLEQPLTERRSSTSRLAFIHCHHLPLTILTHQHLAHTSTTSMQMGAITSIPPLFIPLLFRPVSIFSSSSTHLSPGGNCPICPNLWLCHLCSFNKQMSVVHHHYHHHHHHHHPRKHSRDNIFIQSHLSSNSHHVVCAQS